MKNRWFWLLIFVLVTFLAAGIGALFIEIGFGSWYENLVKPSFQPPKYVFGPVWIFIFVLIAISGWIVYIRPKSMERSRALRLWQIQLLLNVLWSILFFGFQTPLIALIEMIILWFIILIYMIVTWEFARSAAALFIPNSLWVAFASVLNFCILVLR